MKKVSLNQMEATLGGDWRTGAGFLCALGAVGALAATGGAALPAIIVGAAVYGGGAACGAALGDWLYSATH